MLWMWHRLDWRIHVCRSVRRCVCDGEGVHTLSLSLSLSLSHTHTHRLSGYASSRVRTNVWSRQWTPQRQIFRMSARLCTSCRYIFLKVDSTVVWNSMSQFVLVHKLLADILNSQALWIVRILWASVRLCTSCRYIFLTVASTFVSTSMRECVRVHKVLVDILNS